MILENASSIAGLILTTECIVAKIPEDVNPLAQLGSMGAGMPGMM